MHMFSETTSKFSLILWIWQPKFKFIIELWTQWKDRKKCFVFYYFKAFWHHTKWTEGRTEIVFSLSKMFPIKPKYPERKKKLQNILSTQKM